MAIDHRERVAYPGGTFDWKPCAKPAFEPPSADETAYFHCISRVVNREFVLGDEERKDFVKLLSGYERFCGVQVMTFCVRSNHFHILFGVPPRPTGSDLGKVAPLSRAKPIFRH